MRYPHKISAIVATVLFGAAGLSYGSGTGSDNGSVSYGIAAGQANQEQFATAIGFFALPSSDDTGNGNTALGYTTMYFNQTGSYNTAVGVEALSGNTTGYGNTGIGTDSLIHHESGSFNTASGTNALSCSITGSANTASGAFALSGGARPEGAFQSTCPSVMGSGSDNTADGYQALNQNTTGYQNTASGSYALYSSTVGNHNTASGFYALYSNSNGSSNTADGDDALYLNTTGYENTASGSKALFSNTIGNINVALGLEALYSNTTGSNNIAVGTGAGYNLTYGNNNIDIGNEGVATESGKVRIGTPGTQTATYIAGIETAKITGAAVYVTSSGQLGVLASSERYKTAIAAMGANTQKLQQLRPVTFHLKSDLTGTRQYGLIAEEVAKVYPELVIRDASGTVQGVRYDELAPMLLNEMQIQRSQMTQKIDSQAARIASLEQQLADIQAALAGLQNKDQRVAQR
jgi:hypothetical protein